MLNVNDINGGCYSKLEIAGFISAPAGTKDRLWSLMRRAARHRINEGWRMIEPGVWRAPWVYDNGALRPLSDPWIPDKGDSQTCIIRTRKPAKRAAIDWKARAKALEAERDELVAALKRLDAMMAA